MGDKSDRLGGQVKEKVGRATDDEALEQQGRRDQAKGNLKEAGNKAKDAVKKL